MIYAMKGGDFDLFYANLSLFPFALSYISLYHYIAKDSFVFFAKSWLLLIGIFATLIRYATQDAIGLILISITIFGNASPLEKA